MPGNQLKGVVGQNAPDTDSSEVESESPLQASGSLGEPLKHTGGGDSDSGVLV